MARVGLKNLNATAGSGDIAQNIAHVATAAHDTTAGAANTQQAATELARMAGELEHVLGAYKY